LRAILAISVGCPCGIGPEVAVAAAAATRDATCILVGDRAIIERAAAEVGVLAKRLVAVDARTSERQKLAPGSIGCLVDAAPVALARAPHGHPTREAGAAQLSWIDQATDLVTTGRADALVTGPVSKHAIASAGGRGRRFRGHTEYLAERLGVSEVTMAFWAEKLLVSLVTTHLPIAKVSRAITDDKVASAIVHTVLLVRGLGRKKPRVAVSGLNPHAGEQGLLGREEELRIVPGIAIARKRLARISAPRASPHGPIDLYGPIGAETAIRQAYAGRYDAVVAMYHDQATIPMKLVGFGEAVNVTLGLPIIRTSVDHGTGYDIAGTGKADPRAMQSAIALAVRLARAR
jgi:4-hydroxythreonine-4-phosphate dehydrogenase